VVCHLRSRPSLLAGAILLVLAGMSLYAATRASAASTWTYSDSGCTHREDPRNLRFDNLNGQAYDPVSGQTSGIEPRILLIQIGSYLWDGGLGSHDSYVNFPSSNGGCLDQAGYDTTSWSSGWHVRYWQGTTSFASLYGAAHHDYSCGTFHHQSDWWNWAAVKLANYFAAGFADAKTQKTDFSESKIRQRQPSWHLHGCGHVAYDNGLTDVITQTVPTATIIIAG
jgi:hypothetical protein